MNIGDCARKQAVRLATNTQLVTDSDQRREISAERHRESRPVRRVNRGRGLPKHSASRSACAGIPQLLKTFHHLWRRRTVSVISSAVAGRLGPAALDVAARAVHQKKDRATPDRRRPANEGWSRWCTRSKTLGVTASFNSVRKTSRRQSSAIARRHSKCAGRVVAVLGESLMRSAR